MLKTADRKDGLASLDRKPLDLPQRNQQMEWSNAAGLRAVQEQVVGLQCRMAVLEEGDGEEQGFEDL